jgi:hypothetical protein
MKHIQLLMTLVVIVFLAAACSAPASGNVAAPESAATPAAVKTSLPASPTAAPAEVQVTPFLSAPGLASLKLLTSAQNAGAWPLFEWEAVPGAQRYQLIVFDETGDPYWAWEGTKSQVYMGGTDLQPPDESSVPSIQPGYTWVVVAYDPADAVVAASEIRPISP